MISRAAEWCIGTSSPQGRSCCNRSSRISATSNLLELSDGQHGLCDLIQDLSLRNGKKRAFPDDSLFEIIVVRTGPSIRDFFDRYVSGAEPLPVKNYYANLGVTLVEDQEGRPERFEIDANPTADQLRLRTAWLRKRGRLGN
jgi:predicted metalloprotease with PDZ domain